VKRFTAGQIAAFVGTEPGASARLGAKLARVSSLEDAEPSSIVFAQDRETLEEALRTRAGLILARRGDAATDDPRVLAVDDPKYAIALCAREFTGVLGGWVHPTATVDGSVFMGDRVKIGAGAVVEQGVRLGDDVTVGAGAKILHGVELGHRVIVQAGAVLGSTGFGYVRHRETGEYLLFPQQGKLVVEDDVEIGANTTIDRGALGETRIGRGTKIDNLVQIGHNCRIGRNVIIASQVGISGSCVVGDGAVLAGQVGLGDHCEIGPGVILGGQGGVFPRKVLKGPGEAFAGTPAEPVKEYLQTLARLRRLR
jgi:UDP-3-O-[3-hydroxymyristoyl] glucosamine N-acyltransferase